MKTKYILSSVLLFIVLFNSTSKAQKQAILNLEDVIFIAHNQSPDALIAKHVFLSSYWQYRSFKADYLPAVTLSGTVPNINSGIRKIETLDGDQYVSYENNSLSSRISVSQKIGFTGGQLSINSNLNRNRNLSGDNDITSFSATPLSVSYSQPLFQFNSFKWERITEPIKYEKAKRTYIEALENISIKATNYFFNLLKAKIKLEIAESNFSSYDTLYKVASGRYKLGKIAESELLQIELQYLRNENSVTNSRLDYENELFLFKSFLRLNTLEEIVLNPPTETEYFDINYDEALRYAKSNTSKALELDLNEIETEKSLEQAKMQKRPDINLSANYGLSNTAEELKDVYIDPDNSKGLSVTLSLPIMDWGMRKGRFKMAESNYLLNRTNQEQARIDFEQDIRLKVIKFGQQKRQMLIAAKSDTIAQKSYELTQKRYLIGKINDVLKLKEAQIAFDNARISYLNSIQTYWIEYFQLRKLTLYDFKRKKMITANFDNLL